MRLKRLFARLRDIETGGEGGSAGGGIDTSTASAATDVGATGGDQGASDAGPKSMLEAIEQGLKPADGGDADQGGKPAGDRTRDELGRFAAQNKEQAADGEQGKPQEGQKPGEQQVADEFAMPDGLTPKAQERFQTLVNRVKEHEAALESVNSDMQNFRSILQESGGTPGDFAQALDYMRMLKTGDLRGALTMLDGQRKMIALALGQDVPGADPLDEHPDLKDAVDGYKITREYALQMAQMRAKTAAQQRAESASQEAGRSQQAMRQAMNGALSEIDKMGAEWARTDPDFAAKEDIILKQIPGIKANFPPSMWANQVRMLYSTLSAMPKPQPVRTAPAPLRSSGQSAGARQPTDMLEAISSGLGYQNG